MGEVRDVVDREEDRELRLLADEDPPLTDLRRLFGDE
jgi:hypothetical protein